MNQLQNLLHDALISSQHVEKCALLNKDDYSVKATSIGFQFLRLYYTQKLNEKDIEAFIDAFNNTNLTRERGLFFNDRNYSCLRADEHSIYTKNGGRGLILVQTQKCILMGIYNEHMYPSICVEAMEKLAEYFRQKNS